MPADQVSAPSFSNVQTVWHAVQVLGALSTKEPALGVNEIARRVHLHKSNVSRILFTFEQGGLSNEVATRGSMAWGSAYCGLPVFLSAA